MNLMMQKQKSLYNALIVQASRVFLLVVSLLIIYPLLWNVMCSLKTNDEFFSSPWALPKSLNLMNYVKAFHEASMGEYALNSIFVVLGSLILLLVFTVPASYVLSRFRFKFSRTVYYIFAACIFVQTNYIIVPLFIFLNRLHMLDNIFGLCLVYAVTGFPFTVFLLVGFMKTIPKAYEDSAAIDGCSYYSTLARIIVPMARPGILTAVILNSISFWNEYMLALTFISTPKKWTLPVGVVNLFEVQRYQTDWGALFAGLTMILIPTALIYALTQQYITKGINIGGIKG